MANTTAEKIKVMQSYTQGKVVQYKAVDAAFWRDLLSADHGEPLWDWSEFEYRLKPETHRVKLHWAVLLKNNGVLITTNPNKLLQHDRSLLQYEGTAKILKEYNDFFELPIDIEGD